MTDSYNFLIAELSDKKNQKRLHRALDRIIKQSGVLKKGADVAFLPFSEGTEKCTLFFKIAEKDNIYDEEITIVIRPDNDAEHRVLRVVIQEGRKVFQKEEDKDRPRSSSNKIFMKEIAAIEADVKHFLKDYLRRKENA
ncbi:MAG: hypothetical protein ACLFSL_03975 [Candidatus Woesearchaeota archaeon]